MQNEILHRELNSGCSDGIREVRANIYRDVIYEIIAKSNHGNLQGALTDRVVGVTSKIPSIAGIIDIVIANTVAPTSGPTLISSSVVKALIPPNHHFAMNKGFRPPVFAASSFNACKYILPV